MVFCSGWKTSLLTSVFLLLTSVFLLPHGTMLTAYADVDTDVRCVGFLTTLFGSLTFVGKARATPLGSIYICEDRDKLVEFFSICLFRTWCKHSFRLGHTDLSL